MVEILHEKANYFYLCTIFGGGFIIDILQDSKYTSLLLTEATHRNCSAKKDVLKNFANFRRKRLSWSLLLINYYIEKRL